MKHQPIFLMNRIPRKSPGCTETQGMFRGKNSVGGDPGTPIRRLAFPGETQGARVSWVLCYRAPDYFAAGGGVTTAVIFRIIPSDLVKT
jgi:hypothetical protein